MLYMANCEDDSLSATPCQFLFAKIQLFGGIKNIFMANPQGSFCILFIGIINIIRLENVFHYVPVATVFII